MEKVKAEKLQEMLRKDVVVFTFKKLDGTMRAGMGTTDPNKIPAVNIRVGTDKPTGNKVPFFDLEKGEWRSVSKTSDIYI